MQSEAENLYAQGTALLEVDPTTAIILFNRSLELSPNQPTVIYNRAVANARVGRDQEALEDVKQLEKMAPALGRQLRQIFMASALPYVDVGNVAFEAGNLQLAIAKYESALVFDSQCANAWVGKGIVAHSLDRVDEAMMCYSKAIALDSANYSAWINRADLHLVLQLNQQAVEDYTNAIAIAPLSRDAYVGRSVAYLRLLQLDKAAADELQASQLAYEAKGVNGAET